jgi:hypothetical protein
MPSLVEIPLAVATIFKMAANKIVKLSMVSDFIEN